MMQVDSLDTVADPLDAELAEKVVLPSYLVVVVVASCTWVLVMVRLHMAVLHGPYVQKGVYNWVHQSLVVVVDA
jgi:hypothetical protein